MTIQNRPAETESLARRIAYAMFQGSMQELPRPTDGTTRDEAWTLLQALVELRREFAAMRSEHPPVTLKQRVAACSIAWQIEDAITDTDLWLKPRRTGYKGRIAAVTP